MMLGNSDRLIFWYCSYKFDSICWQIVRYPFSFYFMKWYVATLSLVWLVFEIYASSLTDKQLIFNINWFPYILLFNHEDKYLWISRLSTPHISFLRTRRRINYTHLFRWLWRITRRRFYCRWTTDSITISISYSSLRISQASDVISQLNCKWFLQTIYQKRQRRLQVSSWCKFVLNSGWNIQYRT